MYCLLNTHVRPRTLLVNALMPPNIAYLKTEQKSGFSLETPFIFHKINESDYIANIVSFLARIHGYPV